MSKPTTMAGYDASVTDAAERVLVTLLRGFGPTVDRLRPDNNLTH